jgi:hypothetical protein
MGLRRNSGRRKHGRALRNGADVYLGGSAGLPSASPLFGSARPRAWALRRFRFCRMAAPRRRRRAARALLLALSLTGRVLAPIPGLWQGNAPIPPPSALLQSSRCRSSVVEHSLGKGEVVSSILTGSTIVLTALSRCARVAKSRSDEPTHRAPNIGQPEFALAFWARMSYLGQYRAFRPNELASPRHACLTDELLQNLEHHQPRTPHGLSTHDLREIRT